MRKPLVLAAFSLLLAACESKQDQLAQQMQQHNEWEAAHQRPAPPQGANGSPYAAGSGPDAQYQQVQAERARRAAEQAAEQQRVADTARAHAAECAASYPARLADWRKALGSYAKDKAEIASGCRKLARSCVTSSSGESLCRGLTGEQQRTFDTVCRRWPDWRISSDENSVCSDVDEWNPYIDFKWSDAEVASFRKGAVPQE